MHAMHFAPNERGFIDSPLSTLDSSRSHTRCPIHWSLHALCTLANSVPSMPVHATRQVLTVTVPPPIASRSELRENELRPLLFFLLCHATKLHFPAVPAAAPLGAAPPPPSGPTALSLATAQNRSATNEPAQRIRRGGTRWRLTVKFVGQTLDEKSMMGWP